MATKCIDISENRKLGTQSPLAIFAFIAIFIVLTAFMDAGFTYIISLVVSYVLTQVFFQFTPRYIFLLVRFLLTNYRLTPTFKDKKYIPNHRDIKALQPLVLSRDNRYYSDFSLKK